MTTKPRFTLKAILGCTAALCVPLAIIAAGEPLVFFLLPIVAGGCIGYLVKGRDGMWIGFAIAAMVVAALLLMFVGRFFWGFSWDGLDAS